MNGTVSFKGTLLHNGSVQTQWPYRYINVLLYSRSHCLMRLRRGICVRFSRIFSFNRMHGKIWSFFRVSSRLKTYPSGKTIIACRYMMLDENVLCYCEFARALAI